MSEHTPGPWHVYHDGNKGGNFEKVGAEGYDQYVEEHRHLGGPLAVATVYANLYEDNDMDVDAEKRFANARLIAAAPELLEQVKQFARVVRMLEGTEIEYSLGLALAETLRNSDEIVAKAEGVQ